MKTERKDLDIHADDYALSPKTSEDILNCIREGKLDSISVVANMSCCGAYAKKYKEESGKWKKQPLLSVHLNFMEGHCLAPAGELPHLVDEKGYFTISWGSLLLWNYCPWKYRTVKAELKKEIKAQTETFLRCYCDRTGSSRKAEAPLRFDGHQHTQMIPIVCRALMEVIEEEKYPVEYIRITKEPVLPFLRETSLWKTYRPVNWIKNLLLNFFAPGVERRVIKSGTGQQPMFLWGVLFSGHMDRNRVGRLLERMKEHAGKRGRTLEILFHPGTAEKTEMGEEFNSAAANEFYLSQGRHEEYTTVMTLKGLQSHSGLC